MEEIERFVTTVEVEESQAELLMEFQNPTVTRTLNVFYNGEKVYHTNYSGFGVEDLLKALTEAEVPGLEYTFTETASKSYRARFDTDSHDTFDKDGHAEIEVVTYGNEPDYHYKRVEKVRNLLADKGFHIKASQCEMVQHIIC